MKTQKPKRLLITGAASGIGAAIAKLAAVQGHAVILADINLAGAQAVADQIGPSAMAVKLDITSEDQWEQVLDDAWSRLGGLDVLINNAAIVRTGRAENVAISDHQQTLNVNFMGPLKGMMKVLPRFKQQGSGHFVTVCSMTAFLPFPGLASYAAAKHALRAFHHALAIEERDGPLKFTIVHPTSTETPMLEEEALSDEVHLAFASPSVSADFVADVVITAMNKASLEVFMPPERGKTVRLLGTNPRALRKMVERGEQIGLANLQTRRGTPGQPESSRRHGS